MAKLTNTDDVQKRSPEKSDDWIIGYVMGWNMVVRPTKSIPILPSNDNKDGYKKRTKGRTG